MGYLSIWTNTSFMWRLQKHINSGIPHGQFFCYWRHSMVQCKQHCNIIKSVTKPLHIWSLIGMRPSPACFISMWTNRWSYSSYGSTIVAFVATRKQFFRLWKTLQASGTARILESSRSRPAARLTGQRSGFNLLNRWKSSGLWMNPDAREYLPETKLHRHQQSQDLSWSTTRS